MAEEFNPLATDTMQGVTELPDGGALIELDSADDEAGETDFTDNLAESLDSFQLNSIASDLLDLIEKDKEARKERDKQQEEGIRRTGLGADAPGGATFDGASKVVHPVLAEGCVDFSARAIKELFPSSGPVRTKVVGDTSDENLLKKARAKRDFLNFYLVERMPEYRSEKEIMLTQLPLGGSQYEKYWFDGKRVRMAFLPIDKVFLPFAANSFYTAGRKTEEQTLTESEVQARVDSGFYADVFTLSDEAPDSTASEKANQKIEGKTPSGYNEDGVRIVYEVTCLWDVEGDGAKPYVIHIDEPTGKVAAIYRNWKATDDDESEVQWHVENKFIPWRGAYGIGFPHLIGGLAASLTGSLRALLDSAHINNAPTAIKLKGGRASGQNVSMDITSVTEIEAPAGVDDIRKIMMPMPFNPPSSVLFQLMDWLTAQAKGVVATAEEKIADAGANMPVGTTLALIEQGSQVFSAIHARLHESQRQALKIICRLIADYPEHALADMGRFGLVPADFLSTDDVEPVSDPNIFSETQRFAQMQSVMQLASQDAQDPTIQWNKLALRRRMLELLRVDGIDELLPKPPQPITSDPVSENVALMQGQVVKAVMEQDHQAHIKVHLMYILQPMIAQGPAMVGAALAKIMDHVHEHLILDYAHVAKAATLQASMQLPGAGPDQIALQAAMLAQESMSQTAQGLIPLMTEALQVVQSKTPPPPVDPGIQATKEVAMAQLQATQANDKAKQDLDAQKFQLDATLKAQEAQLKAQEQQAAPMLAAMQREFDAKLEVERMQREDDRKRFDAMIEMQKNEADNRQHQMTELMKNRDDNETAIKLQLMKLQEQVDKPAMPSIEPMFADMQGILSQVKETRTNESLDALMRSLDAMMQHMNAPTELIKDANGKTVGMRKVAITKIEE